MVARAPEAAAGVAHATVLHADNLGFAYPQRVLFADWSTRIPPGLTWVTGGEGSGKTTLLRLFAGVLPSERGRLSIQGAELGEQPAVYRQRVFWADPRSDALDQVSATAYFESLRKLYPDFDRQKLLPLIDGLSISEHVDKPMYMLSTGSRRKVWLAAAFASGAAVILLDDPFAALDKPSISFTMQLLEMAARLPASACVMSHYEAPGNLPLAATIDLGS